MLASENVLRRSPLLSMDQQPPLDLDFQNQRYFQRGTVKSRADILPFTRASGASRYNATGVFEWLASNDPRIDYDPLTYTSRGLLCEASAINSVTASADQSAWTKSACSVSGSFTAPDNSSASIFLADGTAASHRVTKGGFSGPVGNATVGYSCFVYIPSGSDVIRLFFRCRCGTLAGQAVTVTVTGSGASAAFAFLSSSPFGANAPAAVTASAFKAEYKGNGVWRLSVVSAISNAADTVTQIDVSFSAATTEPVAGTGNTKVGLWGLQVESARVSSHIPTSGTAVARAIDFPTLTLTAAPWYNAQQWTLVFDGTPKEAGGPAWTIDAGSASNSIDCVVTSSAGITITVTVGGVAQATLALACTPLSGFKVALSFAAGVYAASVNGGTPVTATAASSPTPTRLVLMSDSAGSASFNGWCRRLKGYRRQYLTSALQTLSA